jgi:predicted Zn-dependent protease
LKRALLAILTAATCMLASAQDEVRLPDIGSSAGTILSPDQERAIGENMLRQLRGYDAIVGDPQIQDFIDRMGYRLVALSDRPEQPFTFFVVRSPAINAFAAPGGYVGVFTGLIATAESESELAAVLAHETAHVTQKHLVRAFERIRNASLPIALAILGALIAAQAGGSGDAAQAAVVGGSALLQQQQINFTRDNEYEADRIGIHLLAESGYEPDSMAVFFGRMGRALRSNGDDYPEFLRTHPVSTTRISEAKARADAMRPALARTSPQQAPDQAAFLLFRERARVLGSPEPLSLVTFYRNSIADSDAPHLRYGLGLALAHANRASEGVPVLEALARTAPGNNTYALALAEAESLAGLRGRALGRLGSVYRAHPDNRAVATAYSDALVQTGDREPAIRASEILRPLVARDPGNPTLQLAFARACELAGEEVRAGEAHAEVALLNGRFDDALGQLSALLRRDDVDYYQRARIEARIAEVTPYALEERRRLQPGPA